MVRLVLLAGSPLLGLERPTLFLLVDLRRDDLEDLAAQQSQFPRTVVAGLGDEVCLGLRQDLGCDPLVEAARPARG